MEWKSIGMMTFPTEWNNNPTVPNNQPELYWKLHKLWDVFFFFFMTIKIARFIGNIVIKSGMESDKPICESRGNTLNTS